MARRADHKRNRCSLEFGSKWLVWTRKWPKNGGKMLEKWRKNGKNENVYACKNDEKVVKNERFWREK